MKSLILILFLVAGVQAQDSLVAWEQQQKLLTTCNFHGALDSTGWTTIVGKDTTKAFPLYSAVTVLTILQLWTQYEKECYADSTLTHGAMFRDWEGGGDFWTEYHPRAGTWDANMIMQEDRWTHREPTFPGFINYLKSKVKK